MSKSASFSFLIFVGLFVVATSVAQAPLSEKIDDNVSRLEAEINTLSNSEVKEVRLQAIQKCDEAIKLLIEAGNKSKAAHLYNIQGVLWMTLSDYQRQLESYKNALTIYESIGDTKGSALSLMNVGDTLTTAGEYEDALKYLKLAIPKFRADGNFYYESIANWTIAGIHERLGQKEKALEYYLSSDHLSPSADGANSIALAYDRLRRFRDAYRYYQKAMSIQLKKRDTFGLAKTYSYLGSHFALQNRFKLASSNFSRALEFNRQLPRSHTREHSFASILTDMGLAHARSENYAGALKCLNEAGEVYRRIGDGEGEAIVLQSLGDVHGNAGEFEKSRSSFLDEIAVRRRIGNRLGEAFAVDSLRWASVRAGDRRVAIIFGKQAINQFQDLRGAIKGLDAEARRSFLKRFEGSYKSVADMLVAEGRLPEAQAVLAMLKDEEVLEYVQRDAADTDRLSKRADLREDEKAALSKYEELASRVASVGSEFGKLQQATASGHALSPHDTKRYADLASELERANTVFQVFLRELSDEFAKKPKVIEDIQENAGLQSDLKSWGDGVVALYTIAGDDRYRVILTTPEIQTDGKTEIKSVDLNIKIAAFRTAVQNPRVDPRPLAKELYDIIVKPVEAQLAGANAKTLLWSLDGALRYVPIAALWDGKQYFGQKYQNVIITLASRTRLSQEPKGDWRMLGLGVTASKQVAEPNGSRVVNFSALPAVKDELSSIVRESAEDAGVIAGTQLIDEQFTEQSLKERLGQRFSVVHIASHFAFRPGDMTRSFLLMGDGSALTMDKIKTSPQLKFTGIELLTLSACNTAVGEADSNGREVESFAVIAQQNGAKAVMATLWPVADESTALLMADFYRRKSGTENISKAEALQLAQGAMIDGKLKASGTSNTCRAEKFGAGAKQSEFKCDPNAPFSHPYFWSPFVLIGNWR